MSSQGADDGGHEVLKVAVFVALLVGFPVLALLAYIFVWPGSPFLYLPVLGLLLVLPLAAVAVHREARVGEPPEVSRSARIAPFLFILGLLSTVLSFLVLVTHVFPIP